MITDTSGTPRSKVTAGRREGSSACSSVCSVSMSSEVQPRPDDSPNTSGGSSDAEQREAPLPEQPGPEQRDQTQPKKKEAKISSKTAAKLSTSAKR